MSRNPLVRNVYWLRLDAIVKLLPKRVETLLDLGFGQGLFLPTFSRISGIVVGADISVNPLATRIVKLAHSPNVNLSSSDARSLCFRDQCFDFVVASNVLEHIPKLTSALDEIDRVLKPQGRLISVSPYENALRAAGRFLLRKGMVDHFHDARNVRTAIEDRFDLEYRSNLPRDGPSWMSLFQILVARKRETGRVERSTLGSLATRSLLPAH